MIIIEDRITEVDTEGIIEMIIMKETEVGLDINNFLTMSQEMIEVIVGLSQVQELVQIEIGLDAISVGNTITSPKIVQHQKYSKKQNKYNKYQISHSVV